MPLGRDRKGAGVVVQHRVVIRPDEVAHQGLHRHTAMAYYYMGLSPGDGRTPQRSVVQVHNEQGLPRCATRAQGPSGDQVGPG
ncbi:unnamed protein product [Sphagnum jensenii]